jgi:DNA-binding LytR/AlgR family response regulator
MTTALIADDEPALAQSLASQLRRLWPALEIVAITRDGVEAAGHIATLQPDLAFLDIQMPGLTGLEVAQGIEGRTRVVFVTAYDDYALRAFEHAALDYVLKPVRPERLQRTVERLQQAAPPDDARLLSALQRLLPTAAPAERLRWVRASSGDLMHQVPVEQVLFFRADEKYTCAQTTRGEYLLRTPIQELVAQLDPVRFVQVHRSTIVNVDHVAGTRRDEASRLFIRIRGHAQELPVSRAYVHLFKAM